MSRSLQLKQAIISALTPTRYARTSESLGVGYSAVGFEIKTGGVPDPVEELVHSYSTVSFEIKQAIPPQSRENLGIGYSAEGFALKRHPMTFTADSLGSAYSTVGFVFKSHPAVASAESLGTGYACQNFEYTGSPSTSGQWDPVQMTVAPHVVLDDLSSVTDVSGHASQWYNRASSGWHAEQATVGARPQIITGDVTTGRRFLRFSGDRLSIPGAGQILGAQESGWMFVAAKKDALDGSATDHALFVISTATPGYSRLGLWNSSTGDGSNDANAMVPWARRLDADTAVRPTGISSIGADWALYLAVVDYSDRTLKLYRDGVLEATAVDVGASAGLSSNTDSTVVIGASTVGGGGSWNGDLACALAGRGVPSPTEIDRLFGYYANRYNLRALLPSDHPYKNNVPYPFAKVIDFQFEGSDGSTTFTDAGGSTWASSGVTVSTTDRKVGTASYYCAPNVSTGGLTTSSYNYIFDLSVQDFCIQAWVKPEGNFGVNSSGAVISRFGSNSSNRMWALWRDQANNRMAFTWGDGGAGEKTIASANGSVPVDVWAHVAVTRSKNVLKLYINGTLAATGAVVGSIINDTGNFYLPRIGYTDRLANSAWGGYIDQLTVTRGDPVYWGDFTVDLATTQNDGVPSQLVAMLFHADGANNSTALVDSSLNAQAFVPSGGAKLSTANPALGGACMLFDASPSTMWIGQPALINNARAGSFQFDWRLRLDTAIGTDASYLMMMSYSNGAYYIAYEWALRVTRRAISFYHGTRGENQSVLNFLLPDGLNLDSFVGQWNAFSLGRDAAGNWGAWFNGQRCPTYQVSPLQTGFGLGAETAAPYVNAVDLGDLTTANAVRVGGFFADPGTSWAGALDEFRYVVGTCRSVASNYEPLAVPFSNSTLASGDDLYLDYVLSHLKFIGSDADTSTTDLHGGIWTFHGNAQLDTSVASNGVSSLLLDGSGDWIDTPDAPAWRTDVSVFTIEMFIQVNTLGRYNTLFNKRGSGSSAEMGALIYTDNKLYVDVWNESGTAFEIGSLAALVTGRMYHVEVAKNGNTFYLFLDGVLQQWTTLTGTVATNTESFKIGRDGFNSSRDFDGWIGLFRRTNGVCRHQANFTAPVAIDVPPSADETIAAKLTSWWEMDEAAGSRLDRVGTNHLTVSGTLTTAAGVRGGDVAASFNGAGALNCAHNSTLAAPPGGAHCMFGWVYLDSLSGYQGVMVKWDANSHGSLEYAIQMSGATIYGSNGGANYYNAYNATAMTTGVWAFVVLWKDPDSDTVNFQVNDGAIASVAMPGNTANTSTRLSFGSFDNTYFFLRGRLSRWGWMKGAFPTAAERTWLYNAGLGRAYSEILP